MAKANGTTCLLTGGSGCGKTYAIDKFLKKNPLHTYRIIINDYYKLNDVINELMKLLNIDLTPMANAKHTNGKGKKYRIDAIIERLRDIRLQGGTPMLIIDEGENMAIPMLKMIKALYDQLTSYCAIVILGTEDLIKLMQSRETLYPLYRRFKAGHKRLPAMDRQFDMFLTDTVADKGLRRLLCDLCNNYGELHDYLEPALREADEREVPLTEELFRIMNNIPKLRTA